MQDFEFRVWNTDVTIKSPKMHSLGARQNPELVCIMLAWGWHWLGTLENVRLSECNTPLNAHLSFRRKAKILQSGVPNHG